MTEVYATGTMIYHTPNEFVLDFLFGPFHPQSSPEVRARVVLSPQHMKALLGTMQTVIDQYERHHGQIPAPPPMPVQALQ